MIDNPPWFRIRIEGRFWVNVNFSFPEEIINSLKSHADVTGDKEPGVTRLSPWYRRVKVKVKYLHLYWITLSAGQAVLPMSSLTTGIPGEKPTMLPRVKLGNTLLACDQGNFNQITARRSYP